MMPSVRVLLFDSRKLGHTLLAIFCEKSTRDELAFFDFIHRINGGIGDWIRHRTIISTLNDFADLSFLCHRFVI